MRVEPAIAAWLVLASLPGVARAADVTAAATADRTQVRLSESVRVTLSVEGAAPLRVEVPAEVLDEPSAATWRARPDGPATVTDLPDSRQRWARTYRVDPYVPGESVRLGFAPAEAFAGKDPQPKEVKWEPVHVAVTTAATGDAADARPPTGIEELPPVPATPDSWRDRAAVVAAVAVGVLVTAGLVAWFFRRRRPPPPSAQEWAAARLAELAADDPAFADRLSDILRTFLERRSGLPATRRTTAELLTAAESATEPGVTLVELVRPVLERCDAARFAGRGPSADECRELLAEARAIVSRVSADDRPS